MKKLLIITGPQGSGNHMWSKIFALHSKVFGWSKLLDDYWIGHDQEPFAEYWKNPDKLKQFDWSTHDYYVTSISVPYMNNGEATVPDIMRFAACAMGCGVQVKLAILGRDQNILEYQESRVRGQSTFEIALEQYKKIQTWSPTYLSYELLQLYQGGYLQQLSSLLEFPIDFKDPQISTILQEDANHKYFQPIKHHWVDDLAKQTSRRWQ